MSDQGPNVLNNNAAVVSLQHNLAELVGNIMPSSQPNSLGTGQLNRKSSLVFSSADNRDSVSAPPVENVEVCPKASEICEIAAKMQQVLDCGETSVESVQCDETNPVLQTTDDTGPVRGRSHVSRSTSRAQKRSDSSTPYRRKSISKTRGDSTQVFPIPKFSDK